MNDNFLTGIVSGLVVTIFVVAFRQFWQAVILPWFEDRVYKDIKIEGTWYGVSPTVIGERPETITLKRHGHAVSGSMICNAGNDEGKIYNVSGTFRNMILTLFYENENRMNLDRGTITLRCIHNGDRLAGKIANYHDKTDSIQSTVIIWLRSKEEQTKLIDQVRANNQMIAELRKRAKDVEKETKEISEGTASVDGHNLDNKSPGNEDK